MRKPSLPAEVRTRLLRAGFSRAYANRAARELHEHWSEIVDEGLASGLTQIQAEQEASNRLGPSGPLAAEFIARLQNSSWLGRNPTLGFGALGLTLTLLWWVGFGSVAAQACGLFGWDPKRDGDVQPQLQLLELCFYGIRATSYIVVPWLCCLVAKRYFCGWRPALWACLIVALHNAMHFLEVSSTPGHGNVAWGYTFSFTRIPPLLAVIAPIAVFALYRAWTLRESDKPDDSGPSFC